MYYPTAEQVLTLIVNNFESEVPPDGLVRNVSIPQLNDLDSKIKQAFESWLKEHNKDTSWKKFIEHESFGTPPEEVEDKKQEETEEVES